MESTNVGIASDHSAPSFTNNFLTCFYALLDPKAGSLDYIDAGHNPLYRSTEVQEGKSLDGCVESRPLALWSMWEASRLAAFARRQRGAVPMTEASNTEFTTEELLSQASGNATAFILTTIAYLKERGLDVNDFVAYFGRQFAPGWDELRTQPVAAIARTAALNAVSVGGALGSLSGDETRAEVIMTGWPEGEEISSILGLGQYDSDAMWDSFYPIMERLGIRYAWQREDGTVRLIFERENE